MDPFSALGLASNIVQFLNFGGNLLCGSLELYRSVDGTSSTNQVLEAITNDLTALCAEIVCAGRDLNENTASESELSLLSLASSCNELGKDFLLALKSLKVKGGRQRRWESIWQALRGAWKESQIRDYERALSLFRFQLTTRLLKILTEQQPMLNRRCSTMLIEQSRVAATLDSLVASHRRLEIRSINEPAELKEKIITSLNQVLDERKRRIQAGGEEDIRNHEISTIMSSRLSALAAKGTMLTKQLKIIQSLCFPTILQREEYIKEAHPATFDWLFENSQELTHSGIETTILDWLRSGNGIYWISGKAGSGKSTLMKFFYNHKKTLRALEAWAEAAGKQLLTSSFFFWNAGTHMQKSQQGLLQTLLYNILRSAPALVSSICASHWQDSEQAELPWTRRGLLEAFDNLREQRMGARFCFFIDGLDEYDGDHTEVIEIMNILTSSDAIKICFSSRPWVVFEKAYGVNSGLKLKVHELTRVDITRFVTDELAEGADFQRLRFTDRRYKDLVLEIVDKADGVFLWVFLVVRSLRRGLTNQDTVAELQQRLRVLPAELEEFFQHTLDSVEKVYRHQAARLYQMRLCAPGPLTAMDVSYFAEQEPDFALLKEEITSWNKAYIRERCDSTQIRVMARCADLLEFSADDKLHFLHRTVKDFLETKDVQILLTNEAGADFDAHWFLCNARLMQIKHMTHKPRHSAPYTSLADLFQNFILHAREVEGRDRFIHRFFPDLDRSIELLREKGNFNLLTDELGENYLDDWLSKTSFLRKIPGYMELKVDCELKSILGQASIWLRPPLDIALRAMEASLLQWYVVKRLLDQGANPNEIYGDTSSIWLLYLRSLEGQQIHPKDSIVVYDLIKMLLKCGADPNVDLGRHYFLNLMSIHFTMTEASDLEDLRLLHKQCLEQTQERMEEEMQERVWEATQEDMQEEVQEELQERMEEDMQEEAQERLREVTQGKTQGETQEILQRLFQHGSQIQGQKSFKNRLSKLGKQLGWK